MARTLLDSGWERTTAGQAFELAHMRYRNEYVNITTQHDWEDESLLIHVSDFGYTVGVRGVVSYQEGLEDFLTVLIAWQDRVTLENFDDLLRAFARNGHDAYRLDGDDATPVHP